MPNFGRYLLSIALTNFTAFVGVEAAVPSGAVMRGANAYIAGWAIPSEKQPPQANSRFTHHLRDRIAAYEKASKGMSPSEAAEQWLRLYDAFFKYTSPSAQVLLRQPEELPPFERVLEALPESLAWPALAGQIRARIQTGTTLTLREQALRLLGEKLDGQTKVAAELEQQLKASILAKNPQARFESYKVKPKDRDHMVDAFVKALKVSALSPLVSPAMEMSSLTAPDLGDLLGEAAARPIVLKALLSSVPSIDFSAGRRTQQLAEELALENINQLPKPRWSLTHRIGSPDLFDAMEKRFGVPKPHQASSQSSGDEISFSETRDDVLSQYNQACGYHVLNLVGANHLDEAIQRALILKPSDLDRLIDEGAQAFANAGRASEISGFLHRLLTKHPELNCWKTYVDIAAKAGESATALADLRTAVASPTLTSEQQQNVNANFAMALLADDRVDEGIAVLEKTLTLTSPAPGKGPQENTARESALTLLQLSEVLHRPELTDRAIAFFNSDRDTPNYEVLRIAQQLARMGHFGEAENLLVNAINTTLKPTDSDENDRSFDRPSLLAGLVALYQTAGDNQSVFALLNNAPIWEANDLADHKLNDESDALVYAAASALLDKHDLAAALPLAHYLIDVSPGRDRNYELWLKLNPPDAEAQLTAWAEADRFEERPLIWKAEYLRKAGRLEEAEKVCYAAIAIDPSDGEQPAGDRLRVYAVLADIRASRGDAAQAEAFRNVVRAIRRAEEADTLYQAGLLKRAVAAYEEALDRFSNAYCIQSRLAIRLAESGKFAEAEDHYRRAYELMPESFGRVESHCFGCEKAFGPAKAQIIAERTFAQFAKEHPEKAQIHYLLGYLRSEQDRNREALAYFQEAVRRDPDYLNAWKKIYQLVDKTPMSEAAYLEVVHNLIRLDPLEKHSSVSIEGLEDIHFLFEQADHAQHRPAKPTHLYALTASAHVHPADQADESNDEVQDGLTRSRIVRNHPFFQLIVQATQALDRVE